MESAKHLLCTNLDWDTAPDLQLIESGPTSTSWEDVISRIAHENGADDRWELMQSGTKSPECGLDSCPLPRSGGYSSDSTDSLSSVARSSSCETTDDQQVSPPKQIRERRSLTLGPGAYPCEVCGKTFSSAASLAMHSPSHHRFGGNARTFICDVHGCAKKYSTSEGLRLHRKNIHGQCGGKQHACSVSGCGRTFVRRSDLRMHILRIHTSPNERPFPCTMPGCTKAFACRSELKRHEASCLKSKEKKKSDKHSSKRLKRTVVT